MPSGARPSSRWSRAKAAASAAVAQTRPAGPRLAHLVPGRRRPRLLARRGGDVPHRGPEPQHVLGQGPGVGEPERGGQVLGDGGVPDDAGQLLDDPAEDDVPAVAVGEGGAQRVALLQPVTGLDVPGQAVVTAAGVEEEVPVDARGVAQQVPQRHPPADLRVGDPEAGQELRHRGVDAGQALVDQGQHHRGGVGLGHRADLEQRVGGHLHPGALVQHPGGQRGHLAAGQHGQGHARHLVPPGQLLQAWLPAGQVHQGQGTGIRAMRRRVSRPPMRYTSTGPALVGDAAGDRQVEVAGVGAAGHVRRDVGRVGADHRAEPDGRRGDGRDGGHRQAEAERDQHGTERPLTERNHVGCPFACKIVGPTGVVSHRHDGMSAQILPTSRDRWITRLK